MDKNLTIPEELLLLSLNENGRIKNAITGYRSYIELYMIGSVVIDLIFHDKIKIENKEIIILDSSPTGNAYYDYVLSKINKYTKQSKNFYRWISRMSWWQAKRTLFKIIAQSLNEKKAIEIKENKVLLIFTNRQYIPDLKLVDRIIQRMRAEILEDGKMDKSTIGLMMLLNQARLLKYFFSEYEQKDLKERINSLKNDSSVEAQEIVITTKIIQDIINAINATAATIAATSYVPV